jgi:hypothetical protein
MRQMKNSSALSTCIAFAATLGGLVPLAGCPDREVSPVEPSQDKVEGKAIPVNLNREVDILFVVDNSGSMKEEQQSLTDNFGKFIDVLRSIDGGLPDVHIGVVTSDMGTAGGGSAAGCGGLGDNGIMKTGGVPFTGGANYLIDTAVPNMPGMRNKNYSGDLAATFKQMATVGITGCGFEQHLNSAVAALNSTANANFLRPNAFLAIVFIADEDDCSMTPGGSLVTSGDGSLGPLQSFRCTEKGVIADGVDNMRAVGVRTGVKPRDNQNFEVKVSELVQKIKDKKGSPDKQIIVAGITGPTLPFAIGRCTETKCGGSPSAPIPKVEASCTYNGPMGTQFADSAVRLNAFLNSFRNNSQTTICKEDLSDGLAQIALQLKAVIGSPCFDAKLANPIECVVADVTNYGEDNAVEKLMNACNPGITNKPCWRIADDPVACPLPSTGRIIKFERTSVPPLGTVTTVNCTTTK